MVHNSLKWNKLSSLNLFPSLKKKKHITVLGAFMTKYQFILISVLSIIIPNLPIRNWTLASAMTTQAVEELWAGIKISLLLYHCLNHFASSIHKNVLFTNHHDWIYTKNIRDFGFIRHCDWRSALILIGWTLPNTVYGRELHFIKNMCPFPPELCSLKQG